MHQELKNCLEEIIKEYEKKQIEERILPLLPDSWHFEMEYFIENEFSNRIIIDSKIKRVDEITDEYDNDKFCPADGKLVEVCDKLAAYIEASLALRYGIHSGSLNKAKERLYEKFANIKIANLSFKEVFDYFN